MDYTEIPEAEDFGYELSMLIETYKERKLDNKVIVAILKDLIKEIRNV